MVDMNYLKPEEEGKNEDPTVIICDKFTEDKLGYCDGNQNKECHTDTMYTINTLLFLL